jgi:hypothetical protein
MKTIEYAFLDHSGNWRDDRDLVIHHLQQPDGRANLAAELGRHLALVAGQVDGEDSAGRQKCRLLTPDEVATRALDIAEAMWSGFEKRGWLLHLPDMATIHPPKQAKELAE